MPAGAAITPDRPFLLALRSTRLLAIFSTGFGLVMLVVDGYFNRLIQFRIYFELLATVVWLLPGVAFTLASIMMKEGRRWAVLVAMIAAVAQVIFATALFAANFMFPPISPVPVILSALWIAALIQLLLHLIQSLSSLHAVEADRVHGFELISKVPLAALPIDQSIESERGK